MGESSNAVVSTSVVAPRTTNRRRTLLVDARGRVIEDDSRCGGAATLSELIPVLDENAVAAFGEACRLAPHGHIQFDA